MIDHQRTRSVHAGPHFPGWRNVEDGDLADPLGMIEGEAIGDAPAPVVPGDGETLMAERRHHAHGVARHDALGVALAIV